MDWTFRIGVEANRELALWLWAFDLLSFALGGLLLLRRRPSSGRLEFWAWFRFFVLLFGLVMATTLLRWSAGHGAFFFLRLVAHAVICVSAPLALLRAVSLRKSLPRAAAILATLSLIAIATWLYAHAVEPYRLEVNVERIAMERGPKRPLRVVLLADIQTDRVCDYDAYVLREAAALKPDLVLLAGDMIQRYDRERGREISALRKLFEDFRPWPPLGILAVDGDVDAATEVFAGTRVQAVKNEWVEWPELSLQVLGLSLASSRKPLSPLDRARIEGFPGLTIVLGHAPDFTSDWGPGTNDIPACAMAGHTHGGQVQIPFFGPPLTLTKAPRKVAAGALTGTGRGIIRVSRGIGLERGAAPRLRLLCRPEIVAFDFAARGE